VTKVWVRATVSVRLGVRLEIVIFVALLASRPVGDQRDKEREREKGPERMINRANTIEIKLK